MITKRVYFLVVNEGESPIRMEAYDIMDSDEITLAIAHELRSPQSYVRVLSQRDQMISVFSILDYLAHENEVRYSKRNFDTFVDDVQRYIQSISLQDLFWVWTTQFDPSVPILERNETVSILQAYELPIDVDDISEQQKDWNAFHEATLEDMRTSYDRMMDNMYAVYTAQCKSESMVPFTIRKTRIRFTLPSTHSLFYILDALTLTPEWCVATYKHLAKFHPSLHIDDEETSDKLQERLEDRGGSEDEASSAITILHRDLDQMISISPGEVVMDVVPFDDIREMRDVLLNIVHIPPSDHYETMSVSGTFYLKNVVFEKLVLQDFLMNDEVASHYFYVNELERAYRHGENVTVHFDRSVTAILVNRHNDTSPRPSSLSYFEGNYVKVNILRATGSRQNLDVVTRFQEILCAILHRFANAYEAYQALYFEMLPSTTPTFPVLHAQEPLATTTNFADKYKNVFKHTGYKTSCRPKSRMPTIVSETDARALNPLKVIRFPKPNDPKLDIPMEYLTCDDPNYPFPGIASLGGGDLFVPCCFNKNPRSSRAFVEYYQGVKSGDPKGTEHVKSESQIIKTFGDLGRLPSQVHQFMIALLPDRTFLRAGAIDSSCGILHSLDYLTGRRDTPISDGTVRQEFASFFGTNLTVCRPENPNLSLAEIQENLKDSTSPIDPRRYIRLLEVYYDVNIIILCRTKKKEEIEILTPFYRQYFYRYDFDASKPFVFLYEHWGTSPDRYTKRQFPVYEMIVSPMIGVDRPMTSFVMSRTQVTQLSNVYRTLFHLFPLQQNVAILRTSKSVRGQWIDHDAKLRTLIVEYQPGRFVPLESSHPLPVIYIPNEREFDTEEVERMWQDPPTIDALLESRPFRNQSSSMQVERYVQYQNRDYVILSLTNGFQFKAPVRMSTTTGIQVERVRSPVMTILPYVKDPPLASLARKKQLARIIVDYVLYLYATFYYDATKSTTNDDYEAFFKKHSVVVPEYAYTDDALSEEVDGNPLVMNPVTKVLFLDSKKLQNKLEFMLKYHRQYESPSLDAYRNISVLPHFWEVPYDFRSWKHLQLVSVFERCLKKRTTCVPPSTICDSSLLELEGDRGYWYVASERPVKAWSCPFRYVKVESTEEAVRLTLYWRRYRSIPSFEVDGDVTDRSNVEVVRFEDMAWTKTTFSDEVDPVFVVRNKTGDLYVLLEMKN